MSLEDREQRPEDTKENTGKEMAGGHNKTGKRKEGVVRDISCQRIKGLALEGGKKKMREKWGQKKRKAWQKSSGQNRGTSLGERPGEARSKRTQANSPNELKKMGREERKGRGVRNGEGGMGRLKIQGCVDPEVTNERDCYVKEGKQ